MLVGATRAAAEQGSTPLSTAFQVINRTLLTLIRTLLTRLGVIPRTLQTNLII
jgi:hypothetical protein